MGRGKHKPCRKKATEGGTKGGRDEIQLKRKNRDDEKQQKRRERAIRRRIRIE